METRLLEASRPLMKNGRRLFSQALVKETIVGQDIFCMSATCTSAQAQWQCRNRVSAALMLSQSSGGQRLVASRCHEAPLAASFDDPSREAGVSAPPAAKARSAKLCTSMLTARCQAFMAKIRPSRRRFTLCTTPDDPRPRVSQTRNSCSIAGQAQARKHAKLT